MSDTDRILDALRTTIKILTSRTDALSAKLDALSAKLDARPAAPAATALAVASDDDLDRTDGRGDPEVRRDPKRWKGDPIAPARMSQCPPDYLDCYAEFKEWQASQEDKKGDDDARKKAHFCRLDASRARGWAARARARPPADEPPDEL